MNVRRRKQTQTLKATDLNEKMTFRYLQFHPIQFELLYQVNSSLLYFCLYFKITISWKYNGVDNPNYLLVSVIVTNESKGFSVHYLFYTQHSHCFVVKHR